MRTILLIAALALAGCGSDPDDAGSTPAYGCEAYPYVYVIVGTDAVGTRVLGVYRDEGEANDRAVRDFTGYKAVRVERTRLDAPFTCRGL